MFSMLNANGINASATLSELGNASCFQILGNAMNFALVEQEQTLTTRASQIDPAPNNEDYLGFVKIGGKSGKVYGLKTKRVYCRILFRA